MSAYIVSKQHILYLVAAALSSRFQQLCPFAWSTTLGENADTKRLGATDVTAWLGPCIRTRCYEFGAADLDEATDALGPSVRSTTAWGTPAFDVTAAVRASLASAGVHELCDTGVCTACSPVHFSHRARAEPGRQAALIWLER